MTVATPSRVVVSSDWMLPHAASIRSVQSEAYGISTFQVEFEDPAVRAGYRFKPGQFNMLYVPGFGESAISMSGDPGSPQTLKHTIRFVGNVTRALSRMRPGDMLGVRGPFGSFWPVEEAKGKDVVIVAGGIGLPPLRPAIYEILRDRADYKRVIILYGARTPADLLYTSEYESWRGGDVEMHVTVDRADDTWTGQVGVVPLLFYRIRFDPKQAVVFTVGPEIMMRFVIYEAIARRVPAESIFVSLERNMKCAIGICGHCQFGPMFVCRDGPVFPFSRIEPFFNREEF